MVVVLCRLTTIYCCLCLNVLCLGFRSAKQISNKAIDKGSFNCRCRFIKNKTKSWHESINLHKATNSSDKVRGSKICEVFRQSTKQHSMCRNCSIDHDKKKEGKFPNIRTRHPCSIQDNHGPYRDFCWLDTMLYQRTNWWGILVLSGTFICSFKNLQTATSIITCSCLPNTNLCVLYYTHFTLIDMVWRHDSNITSSLHLFR